MIEKAELTLLKNEVKMCGALKGGKVQNRSSFDRSGHVQALPNRYLAYIGIKWRDNPSLGEGQFRKKQGRYPPGTSPESGKQEDHQGVHCGNHSAFQRALGGLT